MPEHDLIAVLEGQHRIPPLPDMQMVVQNDLTAVLSAAPRPTSRAPQSLSRHLQDAATHLARQTACMRLAPLLPVRLDTPITRAGAAACLTANQPFLAHLLSRSAGMAQMRIAVRWAEAATDPSGDAGDISPQDPRQAREEGLHRMSLQLSMMVGAELAAISTSVLTLPLSADLLWNGIVLLPLSRLSDLTRALGRVAATWPQGLHIQQTGPEPITAFATLDLSSVTARQVDQALLSFGLQSHADLGQLAAARRRRLVTTARLDDAARRAEIADQAEILAAAARLPDHKQGFALCRIWTEGRTSPLPARQAVA